MHAFLLDLQTEGSWMRPGWIRHLGSIAPKQSAVGRRPGDTQQRYGAKVRHDGDLQTHPRPEIGARETTRWTDFGCVDSWQLGREARVCCELLAISIGQT